MSLQSYRRLLLAYLRPQRRRVAVLGALLLASLAVDLVNPLILRQFIDLARQGAPLDSLLWLAVLFLLIALATQGVTVAEAYVSQNVGLTATNQMRADLTTHLLDLDPAFHNAHTPGELIERVDGDVSTLGNFFSRFVIYLIGNALLLVGVLIMLFGIDWRVGAAVGAFTAVSLVALNRLRNVGAVHFAAARQAQADLFGFLEERLAGTEDIRANGATGYAIRQLQQRSRQSLVRQRTAGVIGGITGTTTMVLLTAGAAVALGIGGYIYVQGAITLGTVYLIFSYTELLRRPVEQISRQIQDLQQATAGLARVEALLALRSRIADNGARTLPEGPLQVEFDRVTFGYSDSEPTVRDVSLTVPATRVLGVLGRTGSGKTTLTRLLFRLYDPEAGAVRLGGLDLREVRLADLRTRVGIVTQEISLFHASVRDNLTFFNRRIPDSQIVAALEELGLGSWLRGLPDGLETKLAPGGSGLSAGQAQLVAFARVFLRNPALVILDEASSRLDPATEAAVERAVDRLLAGRTGIIIAHRLATVERADDIVVMEGGRVAEQGSRLALAADPATRFSQLLRTGLAEVTA